MELRSSTGGIALLLSALMLSMSPNGSRADLAPVSRDFRNLCKALNMKCGRSAPAKKTRKAVAPRTTKKSKVLKAKQELETAVPVPRSKPVTAAKSEPPEASSPNVKTLAPANENPPSTLKVDKPKAGKKVASIARPQKDVSVTVPPKVHPAVPESNCLASLRNSGVKFDALATSVGDGRCHVDVPVRLHAVRTAEGNIALPDSPILSCQFARQFALWLSDTGAALVSTHLDIRLAKVSTGPGYECRGRNGDASAKLSEHASGNAVDITTITTEDGRSIQVSEAGNSASPSYRVLRGLRTTACGYFSTVLGPGANAAHASHFHFDMGMHGKSRNYRICE